MKVVATYAERRQMEELIQTNTTLDEGSGTRIWEPGWNFQRVAISVNAKFQAQHAKYVAAALDWNVVAGEVHNKSLDERVTKLEWQLSKLLERLGETANDTV